LGERLLQTEKNGARTTVLAPLCLQSATSGTELFPVFFYILVLGDLDSNFLYYGQPFLMEWVA